MGLHVFPIIFIIPAEVPTILPFTPNKEEYSLHVIKNKD